MYYTECVTSLHVRWRASSNYFEFDYKPKSRNAVRGTVCISGKLKSFKTKAVAQKALEEVGFKVKSSVTKEVTHLVNESGIESDKTRKALANGVQIVTNINTLLGD